MKGVDGKQKLEGNANKLTPELCVATVPAFDETSLAPQAN